MPYKTNADIPPSISMYLPDHAQTIFRKSFNRTYEEYKHEETAFKVAWAAVKKKYEKNKDGIWVSKS